MMTVPVGSGVLTPPVNSQENLALKSMLQTLQQIDDKLGEAVFVPTWEWMLDGIGVVDWKHEYGNEYRLVLDSAYTAPNPNNEGRTWYFEKEILMNIDVEKGEIVFPKVMEYYKNGTKMDPNNKNLNAIWGWEYHLKVPYHGVGYVMQWDSEKEQIVSHNINDAPWGLGWRATPRKVTLEESKADWGKRDRVKV